MKTIKRFLSMFLCVAVLVSAIPLSAIAVSETETTAGMLVNGTEIIDTGNCGDGNYDSLKDNLTYTLYENGLLVIDGTGEMSDFTLSYSSFIPYQPWSEYRDQITSVYISDGVTSIGDYAFWGCCNLSEIQLGDTITSLGSDAFSSTEYVSNSANWDNSILYIGNYLIDSNYSELPNKIIVKDGTKVIADRAFWDRDTLQTIVLPNSLKTIGVDVFSCADGLENIVFNGTVEEYCNVSFGSNLYFRSHNIYIDGSLATNVVIPEGVQNIQRAFDRCSSIVSVSIPSTVTNMGAAFNNCYSLKEVTIANGIKNVTGFTGCSSLKTISLPDSVETISGFSESGLQEITIGKGLKEVTGQTFHNCYNLEKVYYTGSVDDWCQISFSGFNCNGGRCSNPLYFGADLYIDNEKLTDVNIQEISPTLNANSFCGCSSIVNLKLNDQITKIGGGAFDGCASLERVILPFNLEIIGGESFYSCSNLKTITIADKVEEVQTNAFAYCNIENLIIADNSTTISKKMVVAWSSLKNVYIPNSVTEIANGAFSNRTSITDVYFAGSETEWNQINIGTSNECLTNATIHFNSSSPEEPVFIDVRYGVDRFAFGEDITGYVGDEIDSLVVYTSANENIASLDITSSNTDIVEIGTIEIGVGDYITSENEHMATIPLKLKAEGTSTITITSPEGVSESVKVTVTADPISDFNAVTYVADRWLDESDVHYPTIHNFMYNFKYPSYETIKILSTDKDFLASVAVWETANIINDPTQISDDMVNKQQYYEAILFSLLSTQFEEGSLTDYIKATEITKTYKFTKNFAKFVNSIEGLDLHNILIDDEMLKKPLTRVEKDLISNDLKSLKSSQLLEGLKSADVLVEILDYSKDIEEFVNVCGKYLTLLEVQTSTEKLLDTMYELCEVNLLSDADRLCLKEALRCVKNACNSQFGVMLAGIEKGTTQVLQWTADAMCAKMWDTLCSSNVYAMCLKAGLSIGITISNTVFSIDPVLARYYSMLCLNDVRQLINQAVVKLGQDYKISKTQENAEAYISAVGFVFDSYLLGCNYAVDFQKIVRKDSLAGKILFKNDNSFESFKKQAESLENEVSLNYTLLQKQWCYNLLDDYPELFEAVAKEIDLQFYANLEHSSIRVDGLSFDYTGKEITPNITVVMNGKKLALDEDFTVAYSNNVNPGVANVEVTGIGDYHGTNTATFNINEQWFDKKVDIRNNGRATLMRAFSLRSVSAVSNENSTEAPISIHIYDGDKEVALIENGEIVHSDIHVVVYGDRVTILMDNKDYRIVVNADQNTNIDYSYNEYDKELILTKTSNYNNTILTPNTALTQTTGTDIIMCGSDALVPTYSTLHQNNETHHISVVGGASSSKDASQGEWVSVAAVVPDGYKFVEWQASTDVSLLDKNSPSTSFVMSDCDIELVAVFEEELLVDISGSITSFGNTEDTVTIKLLQGSIEIASAQTTNDSYVFEGVVAGTYTFEVSKENHVARTYEITVTDEDVVQDVKIHLLGDINGDGLLNIMDVNRANAHAKKRSTLTGYEFACADINGDKAINIMDVNRMNAHAKKRALLW